MNQAELKGSWRYRRGTIFATLGFCAFVISYTMIWYGQPDSRVAETLITMAFGTASAVVMTYVAGNVIEDRGIVGKLTDARVQNLVDRMNEPSLSAQPQPFDLQTQPTPTQGSSNIG